MELMHKPSWTCSGELLGVFPVPAKSGVDTFAIWLVDPGLYSAQTPYFDHRIDQLVQKTISTIEAP